MVGSWTASTDLLPGPLRGNTGVRFATLMRLLCERNGGAFVALNDLTPQIPLRAHWTLRSASVLDDRIDVDRRGLERFCHAGVA